MNATTLLAAALAAVFLAFGTAKLLAVPSMRARAAHVGLSTQAYRRIGALELAGGLGLLAGFAVPLLRTFAALGLLLLLAGAVITHLRIKDSIKDLAPALVLGALMTVLLTMAIQGS
jgi:uncharacterized membrane protein YphA (DoxX/SURF4 family)